MEDLDVLNLDHLQQDSMFQEEEESLWHESTSRHVPLQPPPAAAPLTTDTTAERETSHWPNTLSHVVTHDDRRESLELFAQLSQYDTDEDLIHEKFPAMPSPPSAANDARKEETSASNTEVSHLPSTPPKDTTVQKAFPEMEVYFGTPTAEERQAHAHMAFVTPMARARPYATPLRSVKKPSKLCFEVPQQATTEEQRATRVEESTTQEEEEEDQIENTSPTRSIAKSSKTASLASSVSAGNTLLHRYQSHLQQISPLRLQQKAAEVAPQSKLQPVRFNMDKIKASGIPMPTRKSTLTGSRLPRRVPQ